MGKLPKQTKREKLIKRLREFEFGGPHLGVGDHPEYMVREGRVVKIPNRHRGDIGEGLLKKVLAEAGISADDWLGTKPGKQATQPSDGAPDHEQMTDS